MKTLTKLCVAVAAGMLASQSFALTLNFGDSRHLGTWVPGVPSSQAGEEARAENLIQLVNGTGGTDPFDGQDFTLNGGFSAAFLQLPIDSVTGIDFENKVETGSTTVNVDGISYVLAKYGGQGQSDGGVSLWYVGGLSGDHEIQANFGINNDGPGLSHYTRYSTPGTTVPDGGMTLLLLGAGMAAVGGARRFIKS